MYRLIAFVPLILAGVFVPALFATSATGAVGVEATSRVKCASSRTSAVVRWRLTNRSDEIVTVGEASVTPPIPGWDRRFSRAIIHPRQSIYSNMIDVPDGTYTLTVQTGAGEVTASATVACLTTAGSRPLRVVTVASRVVLAKFGRWWS